MNKITIRVAAEDQVSAFFRAPDGALYVRAGFLSDAALLELAEALA